MISDMGNNGARSSGPTGCNVPGCNGGGSGTGRSAMMLYQPFGMRSSPIKILRVPGAALAMAIFLGAGVFLAATFFGGGLLGGLHHFLCSLLGCCLLHDFLSWCFFLCLLGHDVSPFDGGEICASLQAWQAGFATRLMAIGRKAISIAATTTTTSVAAAISTAIAAAIPKSIGAAIDGRA